MHFASAIAAATQAAAIVAGEIARHVRVATGYVVIVVRAVLEIADVTAAGTDLVRACARSIMAGVRSVMAIMKDGDRIP